MQYLITTMMLLYNIIIYTDGYDIKEESKTAILRNTSLICITPFTTLEVFMWDYGNFGAT